MGNEKGSGVMGEIKPGHAAAAGDILNRKAVQRIMDNTGGYIGLAKHCIGLDRKNPYTRHGKKFYRPYRNYYASGGRSVLDDWETMESAGYAKRMMAGQHGANTFYLTRIGLDWLGEKLGIHIYDEED